ncbi:MAG: hypothetical protein HZA54_06395, partial [Planctomycetes bacterium]|nr:hypothetical protein [Planctomycetota bacterium]
MPEPPLPPPAGSPPPPPPPPSGVHPVGASAPVPAAAPAPAGRPANSRYRDVVRQRAIQGFDFLQKDLFAEAIACFNDALMLQPEDPVLLQMRGLARLRMLRATSAGDRPEAETAGELGILLSDLVRSLELDPDRYQSYPAVRRALRWLLRLPVEGRKPGLKEWSREIYVKCLSGRAKRTESLLERAKLWFYEMGEPGRAREEFGAFLRRTPGFEARDAEEERMREMMRENAWTRMWRLDRTGSA